MTESLVAMGAADTATAPLRGQLWAALFESLSQTDQEWVVDRIVRYRSLNEERHIEARL